MLHTCVVDSFAPIFLKLRLIVLAPTSRDSRASCFGFSHNNFPFLVHSSLGSLHSACFYTSTNSTMLTTSLSFSCWLLCWVSLWHSARPFTSGCDNIQLILNLTPVFRPAPRLYYSHHSEGRRKHVAPHRRGQHAARLPDLQHHVRVHGGFSGLPGQVSDRSAWNQPLPSDRCTVDCYWNVSASSPQVSLPGL